MFYVLNLKKMRLPTVGALLFCVLTAIIIKRAQSFALETAAMQRLESAHPVLIIDAGHGGLDGGAVAPDGTAESGINLDIALRLRDMCSLFGVETVMTRTGEDIGYPDAAKTVSQKKAWDQKRRAELINSTPDAVLISIHQNKYPDPRPHGAQVLYGKEDGSRELGECMHEMLRVSLDPENRRVAAPIQNNIYLMRMAKCPAVLVECGFLSNPDEAALLESGEYRTKLAMVLLAAFLSGTAQPAA